MWRSLFLAVGAYICLLGVEALALEKAILKRPDQDPLNQQAQQEVVPPDWAPWSLMGGGAIVLLYSFSIPRRNQG